MPQMIRTGGALFDPTEENVYFLASPPSFLERASSEHKYLLCAINEIKNEKDEEILVDLGRRGCKVFIDSGVFNLTNEHARKHNVSMDDALALAPEEIDGFDKLFEKYVHIVRKIGEPAWGYIEIDQGGRDNKIKTRAKLESMGLRPIPVYHPFNDGWDYFDYLAERYDRICFGNVVQADARTRRKLVMTAWERKRKYPNLWIHLLGYTPNEWLNAYPISSGDSSTWLSIIRWDGLAERTALKSIGKLPKNFQYQLGNRESWQKGVHMGAYDSHMNLQNWRNHLRALKAIGCEPFPPEGKA